LKKKRPSYQISNTINSGARIFNSLILISQDLKERFPPVRSNPSWSTSSKGDLIAQFDFRGYGGTTRLIHRVDLHEALKGAAIAQGIQINLSSPAESVDPEKGTVTLSSGQKLTGDVILGADGIHSAVRKYIVPGTPQPFRFRISMFRMLIPRSKLESSPETAIFIDTPGKMTVF
jgi:2-polyprenyl-6-methoxyphenol hydroxylase-like FAD-dependent oxidoreductase